MECIPLERFTVNVAFKFKSSRSIQEDVEELIRTCSKH